MCVCVSALVKQSASSGNAASTTAFFFYKDRFGVFSEFKSNLLETLRCTKSKQGVKIQDFSSCSLPLISCSWMFKVLFSDIYFQCTFHSDVAGELTCGQQLTWDAKLEADFKKLK